MTETARRRTDESIDRGLDGPTEIRVHGVSGSPPENTLGHPLLKEVAGDKRAGFWRRWYPGGRSADLDARWRLEAYSWGRLTSGPAARAFWLLLLPFMLVNLAHWMLPAVPASATEWQRRWGQATAVLLRLVGLGLTLTMLLSAVQAAVDIVGYQCGRLEQCSDANSLVGAMADGWLGSPGRRIVVTAVVPLAVILLVGLLGRATPRRTQPQPSPAVAREGEVMLADSSFWKGNPGMPKLRSLHVAGATALLAFLVTWPATTLAAGGAARVLGFILCVAALLALASSIALVSIDAVSGPQANTDGVGLLSTRGANLLRHITIGLLVVGALYSAWDWDSWTDAGRLPGLRGAILATFVAIVALLVLLTIAVWAQRPWRAGSDGFRPAVRGLAGPVVGALGFLIAGGFSAGLTYRVAELFGHPVLSQATARAEIAFREAVIANPRESFEERLRWATMDAPLVVPPAFAWAGAAAGVLIIALVLVVGYLAWWVVRRIPVLMATIRTERAGEPADERDVRALARARATAHLTDGAGHVVGGIVGFAGLLVLVGIGVYVADQRNWELVTQAPLSTLTRFGTWAIGVLAIAMLVLFWNTYRNPSVRRTVGIVWDVGSFWPRAVHPLAPPSYGERAVPDLVDRARELTAQGQSVLSGHSQGSVLAAAAVLQLDDATAARSALVTSGSPLRRLYARFFPAYLGADVLRHVRDRLEGRWRNLYRDTDPIGSWALDPSRAGDGTRVDRYLADPERLGGEIEGHSDYWFDPEYGPAVEQLVIALPAAYPPS